MPNGPHSESVVFTFNQFERDNSEAVSVNVFTAVSPPNLMYEDICNLAMNRSTSFIILPFHRRWYVDGTIETEDDNVRRLNLDILEKAPCSVGILVEGRRNLRSTNLRGTSSSPSSNNSSTFNIAVIILGGRDDWEAIALGDNDQTFDNKMLRPIRETVDLTYVEEQVNDGPETSSFLRSVVENYQLIIVGRRYNSEDPLTSGLREWCEFQELGVIGDLLSSTDIIGNYSLLIVQQQQLWPG
ncbi:putative Cation/H+ exchanger 4 [Hibiscus syriacus]|uniref:Cation/H+ exchanger 4 n=1 Tax=Hibiscus syriacus TaxID=106335 RepID=A0A6A2YV35_HIBSY|nr:putative Cation/H+ exchanger 4 [Hibiscus syriacus]